ncbi:MAG: ORF6N domain-containing protein [Verrucomicrobia bacterium]|nr:ORF6N domain-containing protein [Verrucomicrobiota bacterium]
MNQAVRRNLARFPQDFRFQLKQKEANNALRLRPQFVTLTCIHHTPEV